MATTTPGGVIRGYWATGRVIRAMKPMSVMTTLSTVAKMGRSMKKRDSMALVPSAPGPTRRLCLLPGGRGGWRRLAQGRHGPGLRLDLHVRTNLREAADEDPI